MCWSKPPLPFNPLQSSNISDNYHCCKITQMKDIFKLTSNPRLNMTFYNVIKNPMIRYSKNWILGQFCKDLGGGNNHISSRFSWMKSTSSTNLLSHLLCQNRLSSLLAMSLVLPKNSRACCMKELANLQFIEKKMDFLKVRDLSYILIPKDVCL